MDSAEGQRRKGDEEEYTSGDEAVARPREEAMTER
jgi:hypothetical protein